MKRLEGIGKLFILATAIIIVLWLLLDDTRCNRTSSLSEKPMKDAIIKALDSAQQRWKETEDSLKQTTYLIVKKADSLKVLKYQVDNRLKVYIDRSAELAAEVIRARLAGNNIEALDKCDSLSDIVTRLKFSLAYQKRVTDSLLQAKDQLVQVGENRLATALSFNSKMRKSLDSISILYDDLDRQYVKVAKKISKKYALSLSVGYGVGTKAEPQPFVGITFGRTLIRF